MQATGRPQTQQNTQVDSDIQALSRENPARFPDATISTSGITLSHDSSTGGLIELAKTGCKEYRQSTPKGNL